MQRTSLPQSTIPQPAAVECNHHWLIDSPNGPMSSGKCKWCGEGRDFKNSVQVNSWESDGNHLHRNRGLATPPSL